MTSNVINPQFANDFTSVSRSVEPFNTIKAGAMGLALIFIGAVTTANYQLTPRSELTNSWPLGGRTTAPAPLPSESILEIRRRSGLTFDELAEFFGVSRRSLHLWVNGKEPTAKHRWQIQQALAIVREIETGSVAQNREILTQSDASGAVYLRDRMLQDAGVKPWARVDRKTKTPLSPGAKSARTGLALASGLDLSDERPKASGKSRIIKPVKAAKLTS